MTNSGQPNSNEVKIELIKSVKEFMLEALRLYVEKKNYDNEE